MAALKSTVALKGQSRSTFCAARISGTASLCHRLLGHKGDHRPTLNAVTVPAAKPQRRARRKVKTLRMVKSRRVVAAPKRRSRRASGQVPSGTPKLARPSVG
jgi:hypothetical protein